MKYITRITKLTVLPEREPVFSEMATDIEIEDEAAGEFVKLTQHGGNAQCEKSILITDDEWPAIRDAIEMLLKEIEEHKQNTP
jgi:hypothetical protein